MRAQIHKIPVAALTCYLVFLYICSDVSLADVAKPLRTPVVEKKGVSRVRVDWISESWMFRIPPTPEVVDRTFEYSFEFQNIELHSPELVKALSQVKYTSSSERPEARIRVSLFDGADKEMAVYHFNYNDSSGYVNGKPVEFENVSLLKMLRKLAKGSLF